MEIYKLYKNITKKSRLTLLNICILYIKCLLIISEHLSVGILSGLKFDIDSDVFNYDIEENQCFCQSTDESYSEYYDESGEDSGNDYGFGSSSWFDDDEEEEVPELETKNKDCSGKGIFHLGPCKFDAPLAVSLPHFLNTDQDFYARVTGLNPDPEKHHFYMVISPEMGIGMSAYIRMQMNLRVEKSKAFVYT